MLNIVNKSPLDRDSLVTCLRVAAPGAILLIEDGVYGALRDTAVTPLVRQAMERFRFYALAPDLDARAVADRILDGVSVVDYGGFVDLVAEHGACQSWL
ncbi:MAG: sulfurtransferase complex subunit TusB [Burkholderiales bacterium]